MFFSSKKRDEKLLRELFDVITQKQLEYDNSKEKFDELELLFKKYYDLRHKLEKKTKESYLRFFDGPAIYTAKYEPHIIEFDQDTLNNLSIPRKMYTKRETFELLEWTVNNTRSNLEKSTRIKIENLNPRGLCGLSQISTLMPLEELGLKVTYNNVGQFGSNHRHSFGTVTIPIIQDDQSVKDVTYLLDATYAQFFTLDYNVPNCDEPEAGYYMIQSEDTKKFAEELLQSGYVECTEDNLLKYVYGFMADTNKQCEDINIIFNTNDKSSYTREDIIDFGLNLDIKQNKKKL